MKKFNVRAAINGESVITRDQDVAKYIGGYNGFSVFRKEATSFLFKVNSEGVASAINSDESLPYCDLFMVSKKKTVWINMWHNLSGSISSSPNPYSSESEAKQMVRLCAGIRIGTFPIEIEL